MDGDRDQAEAGQAVTLTLEDEIEVSRGNILVAPQALPDVADQFQASIIWFDSDPMIPGAFLHSAHRGGPDDGNGDRAQISDQHQQFRA